MTNTTENKLGVAVIKCYFCGKDKGLVMNTRLTAKNAREVEQMHNHAIDYEPCDECKKLMKQGIMFCSVRDGESGKNPYRTGKMCVIKEEAVEKIVSPELFEEIKAKRFCFIEDSVWQHIGFPAGEEA